MSELVTGQGGQVVGQAFFKLNAIREDFDDLISNIRQIDPDVIFCNLVGPSISLFYQAYAAAGLDPAKMPIVSLTTSEISIQDMGPANAIGHITAASYFQSVETEANRMTLDRFGKWIDRPFVTDMGWEAAYSQVRMVCDAIAKTGTPHVEQIRAALLDASYDAPQGRIRIDEETNHTYLWPRIGRANSEGQFDIVQESGAIVKPDPYLTSHQDVAGDMIYEI
jgi:branched-chain amino acid transport system substrate-binding protein